MTASASRHVWSAGKERVRRRIDRALCADARRRRVAALRELRTAQTTGAGASGSSRLGPSTRSIPRDMVVVLDPVDLGARGRQGSVAASRSGRWLMFVSTACAPDDAGRPACTTPAMRSRRDDALGQRARDEHGRQATGHGRVRRCGRVRLAGTRSRRASAPRCATVTAGSGCTTAARRSRRTTKSAADSRAAAT